MVKDSYSKFQFKEFAVRQRDSAMKIGTDGVLLGAWTTFAKDTTTVLDVGTGTGLIALMLAQRFSSISIDAIELDLRAAQEAQYNFDQSPWRDRLQCVPSSLKEYALNAGKLYDHIVCNPPFYSGSYTIEERRRDQARNQLFLPLDQLFEGANQLLSDTGSLSVILPIVQKEVAMTEAVKNGLFLSHFTAVKGTATTAVKRALLLFTRQKLFSCERTSLTLEVKRHQRTEEHQKLVKAFYLAKP